MATDSQILKASKTLGWVTSFQLADHFGLAADKSDRAEFRSQLNELVQANAMIKAGRGKGTRYAVNGTDPGDLQLSASSPKPKASQPKKRVQRRRKAAKELRAKSSGLKAPPRSDTRRGAASVRKAAPAPRPEPEALSVESESSQAHDQEPAPQLPIDEAFELAFSRMKRGKRVNPWEFSNAIARANGLRYRACSDYLMGIIKGDGDSIYCDRENTDGLRIVIWRPRVGEVKPDRFWDLGSRQQEIPLGCKVPRARVRR